MMEENGLPRGWVETTLGEAVNIKHGFAFMGEFISLEPNNKVLITPGNFNIGGGFKNDKFKYYTGSIPEDYILKENEVIVTMTDLSKDGDTLGFPAKVPKDDNIYLHNQRIGLVLLKSLDFDKEYIYWLLRTKYYQKSIVNSATGSTVRHTSPSRIQEYSFFCPPLPEQKAIASILTSFDDKIELLQAQNETLETIAQTIFKEWFGKYQVGDELPEGWRVGELESFFDFLEGPGIRNWQYTENGNRFINIRLIQNGDINVKNANCVSSEEANGKYSHFQLKEKDFVLSTSGTLGRGAIVRKEHLPLLLNTSVIRFRPKDGLSYGYTYQFLQSSYFLHELESLASGSVQLNFGPMHLRQIVMVLPNGQKLEEFSKKVNPLYDKIIHNFSHIQTLQQTRDTLLPKLMSGKVRVDEFKE